MTLASTDIGNVTCGKALNSSRYWISDTRLSYRSRPWNTPARYTPRFTPIIRSNGSRNSAHNSASVQNTKWATARRSPSPHPPDAVAHLAPGGFHPAFADRAWARSRAAARWRRPAPVLRRSARTAAPAPRAARAAGDRHVRGRRQPLPGARLRAGETPDRRCAGRGRTRSYRSLPSGSSKSLVRNTACELALPQHLLRPVRRAHPAAPPRRTAAPSCRA